MNYREKYLKYKAKYLNLQKGGEFDIETVTHKRLRREISSFLGENGYILDLTYNNKKNLKLAILEIRKNLERRAKNACTISYKNYIHLFT